MSFVTSIAATTPSCWEETYSLNTANPHWLKQEQLSKLSYTKGHFYQWQ